MAYDEELAAHVRERINRLDGLGPVEEKKMFGGLAFLVRGHMALAAGSSGWLMVRVSVDELDDLAAREGVEQMVMGGRPLRSWVQVATAVIDTDGRLDEWVLRGVTVVRDLPAKGPSDRRGRESAT